MAALEELLRKWHRPFPSDPATVQAELRILREQVEAHLSQPPGPARQAPAAPLNPPHSVPSQEAATNCVLSQRA
jgi:hypothetical protein